MKTRRAEIMNAANEVSVRVTEVTPDECRDIRRMIVSRFTQLCGGWPTWIWEHFESAVAYAAKDGWRWIGDYCAGREAIMLFPERDDLSMLAFEDGADIGKALGECAAFEFYITDRGVTFVICLNHHDCIIATGEAVQWLEAERLKREQQ